VNCGCWRFRYQRFIVLILNEKTFHFLLTTAAQKGHQSLFDFVFLLFAFCFCFLVFASGFCFCFFFFNFLFFAFGFVFLFLLSDFSVVYFFVSITIRESSHETEETFETKKKLLISA